MTDPHHGAPEHGLLTAGGLFLDVVFAGLATAPQPGEEQWTGEFGWGPGGIANFAITAARLGCPTTLAAAVGTDPLTELCRTVLAAEHIDTLGLVAIDDWHLPVTAAIGYAGDRALVTGGTPAPVPLAIVLDGVRVPAVATVHWEAGLGDWVRRCAAGGTRVFADLGWDGSGEWNPDVLDELDGCHAFLPNDREAMAYTRTSTAIAAARSLATRVPLSVVTCGGDGVVAVDAGSGAEVVVPPVPVRVRDTTGAGDVFGAALATASLTSWTLREQIEFAGLVAAITVSRPGGASTAPRLSELLPWLDARPDDGTRARFAFLRDALGDPGAPSLPFRRPARTRPAPVPTPTR